MKRLKLLALCLCFVPLIALADPQTADEWYKEGEKQYNLGNFEKAADAFKQGFTLETNESKKPAYLYNVAQAYRQDNRCKDAAFFYKRYLTLKDQDTAKPLNPDKRADIEARIAELETCAKTQEQTRITTQGSGAGSSEGSDAGSGSGVRVALGSDEGSDDDGGVTKGVEVAGPKLLTGRFVGGIAKISAGSLNVPLQSSFALTAGYPLPAKGALSMDVGITVGFTPVKYDNTITGEAKTGSMTEALANFGVGFEVAPKIVLRGDVGAGMLFFGGIEEMGSPFTEGGAATTGILAMLAVRAAVSADYLFSPNLFGTVTPFAFSFSPPKEGMREDMKSLTRIDFMLGLGYRM